MRIQNSTTRMQLVSKAYGANKALTGKSRTDIRINRLVSVCSPGSHKCCRSRKFVDITFKQKSVAYVVDNPKASIIETITTRCKAFFSRFAMRFRSNV